MHGNVAYLLSLNACFLRYNDLHDRLAAFPVCRRGLLIYLFEGFVEMPQVGEPAIVTDGFDRCIGDGELFGSKIHTQLRYQVGQCFMQEPLHRSVHMIDIPFRQVCKTAYALLKQYRRAIAPDSVIQPGGYLLVGRQVIVIQ